MSAVNKPVQEKITDLTEMVEWFQGSAFSLEEAVSKFKAAEALAEDIEQDLLRLKNDIAVVKQKFDSDL